MGEDGKGEEGKAEEGKRRVSKLGEVASWC